MASVKKALVLSGGGGRGAYHVGVIEALVERGWIQDGRGPDIIAGTSIGAINAAAIASGLTVAQLKERWLAMHTEDVHQLSDDLPGIARPLLRFILRSVLTSEAHDDSTRLPEEERGLSVQAVFNQLGQLFTMRPFRSLLDTAPWRRTLGSWIDFERINSPGAPALLLAATELQTGALRVFCNRPLGGQPPDKIVLDHLMASSSIPIVYPWTQIEQAKYWDGAVLANTPLDPVIELAGEEEVDIIVVMMTPWNEDPTEIRAALQGVPKDVVQALWLTLDWALLASYRVAFEMLKRRNELADAQEKLRRAAEQMGDDSLMAVGPLVRRVPLPKVIAPKELMPLEWIVDYEVDVHHKLFEMGKADAERELARR